MDKLELHLSTDNSTVQSPAPAPVSGAETSRVGWRSLRILIVDDDKDTVDSLAAILEDEGHNVRGLCDPLQVLDTVQSFAPEALVVDIAMPKMNGYEVARAVREQSTTYQPLLIAISGLVNKSRDGMVSLAAGFDHHLAKPCNLDELIFLLAPVMRKRR